MLVQQSVEKGCARTPHADDENRRAGRRILIVWHGQQIRRGKASAGVFFRPAGAWFGEAIATHGLRRGLQSSAASRLYSQAAAFVASFVLSRRTLPVPVRVFRSGRDGAVRRQSTCR